MKTSRARISVKHRHAAKWILAGALAGVLGTCPIARAQDPQGESSSKSAPDASDASDPSSKPEPKTPAPESQPPSKKNVDSPTKSAPDQPTWDPLRAEKDLEVGQYYMKKGDLDAAIDRFEDAVLAKPGYAIPFRYLGEAQEKKGMKRVAIKSYTRYLDLYPHAEDADKIHKKIDKLWRETKKK